MKPLECGPPNKVVQQRPEFASLRQIFRSDASGPGNALGSQPLPESPDVQEKVCSRFPISRVEEAPHRFKFPGGLAVKRPASVGNPTAFGVMTGSVRVIGEWSRVRRVVFGSHRSSRAIYTLPMTKTCERGLAHRPETDALGYVESCFG